MADKQKKMTEDELASLLDDQISDAVGYNRSELASLRDKALKYREGVMDDLPAEEGKSSFVSMDVNDTISWVKPGLMRIFANSDKIAEFEPVGREDEEGAEQATDLINYMFFKELDGYKVLLEGLDDGVGLGNGVFMHWWDRSPCYEVETFTGLSDDAFTDLVADDDVKVLEHTERQEEAEDAAPPSGGAAQEGQLSALPAPAMDVMAGGAGGPVAPLGDLPAPMAPIGGIPAPQPQTVHDVKIKRTVSTGRLRLEAMPTEELLIPRDATAIDEEIEGIGRERNVTRSQLVKEGYKRSIVDELPTWASDSEDTSSYARDRLKSTDGDMNRDKSMEKVRIFEWYPLVDWDNDGVAERRRVVIGDLAKDRQGGKVSRKILLNEEWGGDLPFTDIVPDPVAHRRRGRSAFDNTGDIQRIKAALGRQMMDNSYWMNNQMVAANESAIINPESLHKRELGATIWTRGDPASVIFPIVAQPMFDKILPVMDYMDLVKQGRTGIGRQTMGLDPDALQNQTAEAVRDGRAASETQVEFYARNIAEIGLKRLFRCLYRLVVANQDKPKTIRLRNQWVDIDPRPWNSQMDCTINVGLGAGSKDRDMVMLQAIAGKQEAIILNLGPENPLVGFEEYRATLAEMVDTGGLRTADKYFKDVSPETIQMWQQQQAQKPNPEMQKMQMQAQMEQQKLQQEGQMKERELTIKARLEEIQAQADIATTDRKTDADIALKREEFALKKELALLEAQLKMREHEASMQVEQQRTALQMHSSEQDMHMKKQSHNMTMREKAMAAKKDDEGAETEEVIPVEESRHGELMKSINDGLTRLADLLERSETSAHEHRSKAWQEVQAMRQRRGLN